MAVVFAINSILLNGIAVDLTLTARKSKIGELATVFGELFLRVFSEMKVLLW